jgi:hypothetical protein
MYRPLLAFLAALVAIPVLGGDGSAVTTPIQQTSGSTSGFTLEWEQRGFAAARRMPFFAGDINRDGLDEIVSAASTWWSVVSVSGGKPALIYQSPIFNRTITSLAVGQADTDPALEIVIAFDREVRIHDGVTFALQRTLTVPETEIRRMTVGDLQADGSPEIAYCGYYGGRVLNIATGTTLLSRECWDAAIGNVDSDPAAELVLAGGTDFPNGRRGASMVIDGVTQAIEWAPSVSFGNYIALVDDDGDGRSRIVGAQGSGKMHLFDALSRAVVASHTPAYEVDALRVVDAEGTVSSRSSTETTSGEPSWCSNPLLSRFGGGGPIPAGASAISQPPTRIETAKESSSGLLKTSGCSSTSSAGLPMRSRPVFPPTQTLPGRWISTTSTRTASPICWGQAQGPGSSQTPEIAGSPGSVQYGFDIARVAQVDGDPQLEIIGTWANPYDGYIVCLDSLSGLEQWRTRVMNVPSSRQAGSIAIADVDGDAIDEVVYTTYRVNSGYYNYIPDEVVTLNKATGQILTRTPLPNYTYGLRNMVVANIEGDPLPEVVTGDPTDDGVGMLVVNPRTGAAREIVGIRPSAIEAIDFDGDGVFNLVIGTSSGELQFLNASLQVVRSVTLGTGRIHAIRMIKDAYGVPRYFVAQGDEVIEFTDAPAAALRRTGPISFSSEYLVRAEMEIGDADNDRRLELIVNLGGPGFRVYEIAALSTAPPPPSLNLDDLVVAEGSAGPHTVVVTAHLSAPSPRDVAFHYQTHDGDAVSGQDYTTSFGSLTIPAGSTTGLIQIPVSGDLDTEPTETFVVTVQAADGAVLGRNISRVTLQNDDLGGVLSVKDPRVVEGYGAGNARFTLRLWPPQAAPVRVEYETLDGTAVAGSDYTTASGEIIFAPGETRRFIDVAVRGDATPEANEDFVLELRNPTGAILAESQARAVLINDDGSALSVTDPSSAEGNAGLREMVFTVMVSAASPSPIAFDWETVAVSATAGVDFEAASGRVTLPPNAASVPVSILIKGDTTAETNERLIVRLSNAAGATIADSDGIGTIADDDGLKVSAGDRTVREGNSGYTQLETVVSLSSPASGIVTVAYSTEGGTAESGVDFVESAGSVVFFPGEKEKSIFTSVVGDTQQEPYERFVVHLVSAEGASLGDDEGQATIANDDGVSNTSRLLFHNRLTNRLYRWHMKNGRELDTYSWVTPWATDPGWRVGAVADFDQDGELDFLWRNETDGRSLVWFITGDSLKGFAFLDYTLDASWQIVATLDGNGDGAADVLYWQPSTGRLRVVLHRGANRLSDYTLSDSILAPWGVVGAPDLNADGSDDLLILNRTTGQMVAGLLNGPLLTNGGLFTVTRAAPSTWNVASTGTDFDADGHADLLWHDTISGVFSVWFMNGKTKLGEGTFIPFSNTDPAWQVVGAANVW